MKIGMIGLGKLGLPVAVAINLAGHDVMGYDVNRNLMKKNSTFKEQGPNGEDTFLPFLKKSSLKFGNIEKVIDHSEVVFVAVQTPHAEKYDGTKPIPYDRVDFDYSYVCSALKEIAKIAKKKRKNIILVLISTVLPGTFKKEFEPLLNKYIKFCYNPFFIAMGTTMRDFLNPEFVLFGVKDLQAAKKVETLYKSLHDKKFYRTSIQNAELIKVSYNTFIGMKIAFVNTLMEICHKIPGSNVDEVTNALKLADERLISTKYLTAGMGDGGGCHPRDNIALSWLAKKLNLSFDTFEMMMMARERQSAWLVNLMTNYDLPKVILGKAFKPETHLDLGSPSLLCKNLLIDMGYKVKIYDPYIDKKKIRFQKSVFLIGTQHKIFQNYKFPRGSVVIDPWRYIPINSQKGIKVIHVGVNTSIEKQ